MWVRNWTPDKNIRGDTFKSNPIAGFCYSAACRGGYSLRERKSAYARTLARARRRSSDAGCFDFPVRHREILPLLGKCVCLQNWIVG
jgi:hypothetical protein